MQKLLVIEDDSTISELLEFTLRDHGYEIICTNSIANAKMHDFAQYSLIILDLGLPDGDGKNLIQNIMQVGVPIIVLTARTSLIEKVKSFDLGVDDYIQKPFELQELIARVKAVLRRTHQSGCVYNIDGLEILREERRIVKNGISIDVTAREWDLLIYLIDNRGVALSRARLLDRVWGIEYPGTTRTVDVHIQQLRKKLSLKSITTIHRDGYRLER